MSEIDKDLFQLVKLAQDLQQRVVDLEKLIRF